jgi:cellobiose transport system substrate-binding protein
MGRKFVAGSDAAWFDSGGAIYQGMINQVENAYEESDGTPIPLADNAQAKGIYDTVLTAAVDDGLSARLGQWSEDWTNAFQNDGFATMLCPSWMLGVIEGNAAGVEGWDIADTFPGGGGNWGGSFLTVPTQGEHPEEAQALAAWLTAPEQQIKAFVAKGTFPSQVDALSSDELLTQSNAFFNDAPTGEIMSNRAEAITVAPFKGPNYFAIQGLVSDAINRVEVDQTDDAASSWEKAVTGFEELGLS